jgi:hypothetical protein
MVLELWYVNYQEGVTEYWNNNPEDSCLPESMPLAKSCSCSSHPEMVWFFYPLILLAWWPYLANKIWQGWCCVSSRALGHNRPVACARSDSVKPRKWVEAQEATGSEWSHKHNWCAPANSQRQLLDCEWSYLGPLSLTNPSATCRSMNRVKKNQQTNCSALSQNWKNLQTVFSLCTVSFLFFFTLTFFPLKPLNFGVFLI